MKILFACTIMYFFSIKTFAQTPDYQRSVMRGNQAVIDDNVKIAKALSIPVASSWTLNGAKDAPGYIMYNTTLNQFGFYQGSSVWQTIGPVNVSGYVPTSTTVNNKSLTGNITLTPTDIGLGNVNNTTDLAKPISTATQTALNNQFSSVITSTYGQLTYTSGNTAIVIPKYINYTNVIVSIAGLGVVLKPADYSFATSTGTLTINNYQLTSNDAVYVTPVL